MEKRHLDTHGSPIKITSVNYKRHLNLSELHRGLTNYINRVNQEKNLDLKCSSNKTMSYRVQAVLRNNLNVEACLEEMQANMSRRGRKPFTIYRELAEDFENVARRYKNFLRAVVEMDLVRKHGMAYDSLEKLYERWLDEDTPVYEYPYRPRRAVKPETQRQRQLEKARKRTSKTNRARAVSERRQRIEAMKADLKKEI
ncbi:hypothetical protein [Psittacicella melopsittaci]|nr:hypothetical protein [Psittacicella melopsittaci]